MDTHDNYHVINDKRSILIVCWMTRNIALEIDKVIPSEIIMLIDTYTIVESVDERKLKRYLHKALEYIQGMFQAGINTQMRRESSLRIHVTNMTDIKSTEMILDDVRNMILRDHYQKLHPGYIRDQFDPSLSFWPPQSHLIMSTPLLLLSYQIYHLLALPPYQWHLNPTLGKEYYYKKGCLSDAFTIKNECGNIGGDTMASIPSLSALLWFENELITEAPDCIKNYIAFGATSNLVSAPQWQWFNGDSWNDTFLNWGDDCNDGELEGDQDLVLYMEYSPTANPSKFCDGLFSSNNGYSIVCERVFQSESPSVPPSNSPSTALSHSTHSSYSPSEFPTEYPTMKQFVAMEPVNQTSFLSTAANPESAPSVAPTS